MKKLKKILSACSAAAVLATVCAGSIGSLGTVVAATEKTAIELVDDMGMGWNLGNTFDCWGVTYTDQTWTGWGNKDEYLTENLFSSIKSSGFDSVRIPVTWYQHTDSSTFDIDDAYLAKIKEMVDYCYKNDMYVIINMHWDWESGNSLWLNKGLAAKDQFTTMWNEISNYFKDYDEHLVFEGMNEVRWNSTAGQAYTAEDYNILNTFNSAFVDTVRATGGNNADRLLLLPGADTDMTSTCSSSYVVPDDDMVAVSIHYYIPQQWCIATKGTTWGYADTWGTDAEIQKVYNDFNSMKSYFVDKGIPVIIGEYGVLTSDYKDKEDIALYLKTVASAGLNTEGISTFLWDDSTGNHQCFDRSTLKWYDSNVEAVYSDLANGNIDIPENLKYTDRVTYTADLMEKLDDGYNIDLKPYKELGVNIKTIVIEGSVSNAGTDEAYGVGGGVAFAAKQNGAATSTYTVENWFLNAGDTANIVNIDGELTDDDGNVTATYEVEYDYLNIVKWWDWSDPNTNKDKDISYNIDKVTVIFDQKFFINADGTVIIPEETETTETPYPEITKAGDADDDGDVDMDDVVATLCAASGMAELSTQGAINADVYQNGDGISVNDAGSIQKFLALKIDSLPESYL